jgi:hypothetical protein
MDEYELLYLTQVADDPEGWAFVPITVAYALVDTGLAKMEEDLGLAAALSLSDHGRAVIEGRAGR